MSGVSIICFAASYAVALALELTRPVFRSGIRGAVMLAFAGAGLLAHTIYLGYRIAEFYWNEHPGGTPLSSEQEWYLLAAWVLAIVYLYLTWYQPRVPFGLFILPLVLALIGVGTWLADPQPFPRESASKTWGLVHGLSILLATVAVLVGLAAGLMYLGQSWRLKTKSPRGFGLYLPSLERLQTINSRALAVALGMMALGIASGVVLNLFNRSRGQRLLPWTDPVVLTSLVMFGWLVVAGGAGIFYRPVREGRRVAYLTLVGFVFLVIALWSVLWNGTQHGALRASRAGPLPVATDDQTVVCAPLSAPGDAA